MRSAEPRQGWAYETVKMKEGREGLAGHARKEQFQCHIVLCIIYHHELLHLFNKYLMNSYYVPDTLLGTGESMSVSYLELKF